MSCGKSNGLVLASYLPPVNNDCVTNPVSDAPEPLGTTIPLTCSETSIIGNNVLIYHGVTLGGTSLKKGKRHPTINDDAIIGAGAKILGPIIVGKQSRVGANAVVTRNVASFSTVMGVPAKVIKRNNKKENKIFTPYGTPVDLDYTQVEKV